MSRRMRIVITVICAMLLASSVLTRAETFSGCGVLAQGPGCIVFFPQVGAPGPGFPMEVSSSGEFTAGDFVYVEGTIDFDCPSPCDSSFACLDVATIDYCELPPEDRYFEALGVLMSAGGSVLFAPAGDSQAFFELENLGDYGAGDTVRVAGILSPGCQPSSPLALACILNNTITLAYYPGSPISGNAVVLVSPEADIDSVLAGYEANVLDSIEDRRTYLIGFSDSIPTYQFMHLLATNPDILMSEPNFELEVPENLQMSISFPDEQAPTHVPGASPEAYYDQGGGDAVHIDSAHQISTGTGIRVAVIDNGFDLDHPLLAGSFEFGGYDYLDGDSDLSPDTGSVFGHGTFVCGLIKLVAPDCSIVPFRAFDGEGIGNSFAIAQAIYHAIEVDVDVINMSFGMYDPSMLVEDACYAARAAGITLVAAAGNDGTAVPVFPAALPDVIAAGALDTLEYVADFSNFGGFIDVCAPGVSVYSSLTGEWDWGHWSGTSFSTPFVSATCALVLAHDNGLNVGEVKALLNSTARNELSWGTVDVPDAHYGYGCVDAAAAVSSTDDPIWVCGDADGSFSVDVDDVVFLVAYVFDDGAAPNPLFTGDPNCSTAIDVDDIVYLISYVFSGGPEPCCL